jgi:hypothetical protein
VTKLTRGELVFEGEIVGGEPDGEGQEWLPNGDGYVGEFVSGRRHGRGTLTTARCDCHPPWATQGQMDGFFGQLPYKYHLEEVASVGD